MAQRGGRPRNGVSRDIQSPSLITTCWSRAAATALAVPQSVHSPGGLVSRPRQAGYLGPYPSGRRKGPLISPKTLSLDAGPLRAWPQARLGAWQGVGQLGAARGKLMSYRRTGTERELTLHLIPSPDRDTGTQEEEGTCPKSHGTGGSPLSYLEPQLSAPWRVGDSERRVRPDPRGTGRG